MLTKPAQVRSFFRVFFSKDYSYITRFPRGIFIFGGIGHIGFFLICRDLLQYRESWLLRSTAALWFLVAFFSFRVMRSTFSKVHLELFLFFVFPFLFSYHAEINPGKTYWLGSMAFCGFTYGLVSRAFFAIPGYCAAVALSVVAHANDTGGFSHELFKSWTLPTHIVGGFTLVVSAILRVVYEGQYNQVLELTKRLNERDQAKSLFLASMSHEIRTPLHAVIGITQLLAEENPRVDQQSKLKILKSSSELLLSQVNDILDYNRIEAGKLVAEKTRFILREALAECTDLFRHAAQEKENEITLHVDSNLPIAALGDVTRFKQIINNLISNANKFTNAGIVKIEAGLAAVSAKTFNMAVAVSDTGIGIPADRLSAIFEDFTQATPGTTREYGGSGLGLAIVKRLLDLFDGSIAVTSTPSVGSKFEISLNLEPADVTSDMIPDPLAQPKGKQRSQQILVVDDNEINRLIATQWLHRWKLSYDVASGGEEALKLCQRSPFNVMLLDLQMPGMDGFELLEKLKDLQQRTGRSVRYIAVTADATDTTRQKALLAGFETVLVKPFAPEQLLLLLQGAA